MPRMPWRRWVMLALTVTTSVPALAQPSTVPEERTAGSALLPGPRVRRRATAAAAQPRQPDTGLTCRGAKLRDAFWGAVIIGGGVDFAVRLGTLGGHGASAGQILAGAAAGALGGYLVGQSDPHCASEGGAASLRPNESLQLTWRPNPPGGRTAPGGPPRS
ncbi:hypothetical protein J421_5323 (plasmid) [Gemmatirosa kalamazoonensis]|uniref:Glycine zipper 2TM domain-containing protein n=1 Tax=Gemmatirosa kalamazoonensis TaxID=861299 RepID=W0RTE4_9BACT|nr:hypothetical protein J421_5323 [Gemmatirosa kalamazoonensis]